METFLILIATLLGSAQPSESFFSERREAQVPVGGKVIVAMGPEGKAVAIAGHDGSEKPTIRILEWKEGRPGGLIVALYDTERPLADVLAISWERGRLCALDSEKRVRLWPIPQGIRETSSPKGMRPQARHSSQFDVRAVAFRPPNALEYAVASRPGLVWLYGVDGRKLPGVYVETRENGLRAFSWRRDGEAFFAASGNRVGVYSFGKAAEREKLYAKRRPVKPFRVLFSPFEIEGVSTPPDDVSRVAIWGGSRLALWDLERRRPPLEISFGSRVTALTFLRGGVLVVGLEDGRLRALGLPDAGVLGEAQCAFAVSSIAGSSDGRVLLVGLDAGKEKKGEKGRVTLFSINP